MSGLAGAANTEGRAMSSEQTNVFVICAADSIERSGAKAFSLSRINDAGEGRPFSIVVVRTHAENYLGYVNSCPHQGIWLNFGEGTFFTRDRAFLKCGRHGSVFEIDTGLCIDGPCKDKSLEPLALAVVDGEVCVCGIDLEESGFSDPFDEGDDTMEIMIHPG
jgi:nitrite reductase/ring-hydroxylating ferredoxin subunit